MDLHLRGMVALITGGSKGIGRACAEVLASEGCTLHLAARDEAVLRKTKETIEASFGVSVAIHPADLSRSDEARALGEACGESDILVNNAGAIPRGDLWHIEEPQWRDAWDLKVFGSINLCRTMYAHMRSRGKGVIVNIIGAAGERPRLDYIAGGAGNAALMAFTKALGARSMRDGIRVVGVNPGLIKTERLQKLLQSLAQARLNDPGRWQELMPNDPSPGEPSDVANLVAFLVSDCAKQITGTIVTVDGGYTAT
ncbi:MAG: short-chain dehydrogenase/reductase [Deltaproteobacteria bacterium]|nr:short-chain dehydrogenase/reductase [Deltaproteobacteria bacterium]